MAQGSPGLVLRDVFGEAGEGFRPMVNQIVAEAVGTRYTFMREDEYRRLCLADMCRIYWEEILYRVHWAATSNLQRHQRWFESCLVQAVEHPNFLGFCASLRALTEGAADATHSLGSVALTLATVYRDVYLSLVGRATGLLISSELEDALIHFQHARKARPGEDVPKSHQARTAARYLSAIDTSTDPVRQMYEELCQVTHPAMHSLFWAAAMDGTHYCLSSGDDTEAIRDLCARYVSAIQWLQMASVNPSIWMLMVLNAFPLTSLHTEAVRTINMSPVPGWAKIEAALLSQRARKSVSRVRSRQDTAPRPEGGLK